MIQLSNVSLAFGGQQILHNLTWTIKPNQLIGLIGPNGAGKSTLLRALARRQDIDDGDIAITGGTTIGYLEQNVQEMPTDRSIKEEAMQAFSVVLSLQAEEERITKQLESDMDHEDPAYQRLLGELQSIHDQLQSHEAHRIEDQTEAILTGLGFDADELDRPLVTFSGGWRMRVALAKLLLQRPNFLLLDEPTNHLDIDSIDWLEKYLKAYAGTVVIVSHDRYFLDRMVTTTAELYAGTITEYAGNYSFYLQDRVARRELHKASYDNQQKYIAEAERFITRFRAKASKARQVQSRVKLLDKLERIPPPPDEQASITFRFPVAEQSGRMVLEFSSFSKHYDSDEGRIQVFDKTRPVAIERNDKIALTGKNGAGKSTLARMINGTEEFEGERKVGYKVNLTFFAQHQADALNLKHTILDSMRVVSQGQSETELRSVLGAFLFTGDDVFKPIGVLSGGEKSRVALARTLLVPANFLILDEPTNHLDMQSINVLIEALQQYNGTFVVVSHDRHFLDQIVNKVWRVEDGGVQEYIGNYADYQWQIEHGTASKRQKSADAVSATKSTNGQAAQREKKRAGGPKTKEQKRKEAEERNQRYKNAVAKSDIDQSITSPAQLKKAYSSLEFTIETKEAALKSVEADLANPDVYNDKEKANQLSTSYQMLKEELAAMYSEWEKMGEILTEI